VPVVETSVDVIKLLVNYLLGRTEVTALVDTRVYGNVVITEEPTYPLVAMHRFGGTLVGPDNHIDRPIVQFDVWSDGSAGAWDVQAAWAIVAAIRRVLSPGVVAGSHAEGVVVGITEITGPQWLPDQIEGRPRLTWTAQVSTHP